MKRSGEMISNHNHYNKNWELYLSGNGNIKIDVSKKLKRSVYSFSNAFKFEHLPVFVLKTLLQTIYLFIFSVYCNKSPNTTIRKPGWGAQFKF